MKLSILMLTFNHESFIGQAIESALMQRTSFEFELVIGEDCSTDGTRGIIDQFIRSNPGKIRKIFRKKNVGMTNNFVETYHACNGEYVAMLEGDDYWTDPEKLQIQVDALETHREWVACFHSATVQNKNGPLLQRPSKDNCKPVSKLNDILRDNLADTCTFVFRNKLIKQFPKWLFRLKMCDWPMHILNARSGDFGFIDRNMAVYRQHSGGVWSSATELKRTASLIDALECFAICLGPFYWFTAWSASAQLSAKAAHLYAERGEYRAAQRCILRYIIRCGWVRSGYRGYLYRTTCDCIVFRPVRLVVR